MRAYRVTSGAGFNVATTSMMARPARGRARAAVLDEIAAGRRCGLRGDRAQPRITLAQMKR
jgi:hypothetical protein